MKILEKQIHKAWYCDGVEDGKQLWRLDFRVGGSFRVGGNAFQAQLFARVNKKQLDEDGDSLRDYEMKRRDEDYTSFYLMLERDNRALVGKDACTRVDYAHMTFRLTPERALELLGSGQRKVAALLEREIKKVAKLPCEYAYCDVGGPGWKEGNP